MRKDLLFAVAGVYAVSICLIYKYAPFNRDWRNKLKEKFPYPITLIAHRGGSLMGPENTIYTFSKTLNECDVDMLELDVRESKDGKVVVSHDQTLGRSCGTEYHDVSIADLIVGSCPSDTLPQSARAIPLFFQTETLKQYEADADVPVDDTTRVCLLSEVFEKFQGVPLHIDIKDTGYPFVKQVFDMIETYHRETITFVGSSVSGNKVHIKRYFEQCTKEKRSRYRLFGDAPDYFKTVICYYLGLLPFMNIDFDVFSIPIHTHTMYRDANATHGKLITFVGTCFLSSPGLWRYLQHRGVAVIGWVMNDEKDFLEVISLPVNGVMTDDPRHLSRFLAEHVNEIKFNILA